MSFSDRDDNNLINVKSPQPTRLIKLYPNVLVSNDDAASEVERNFSNPLVHNNNNMSQSVAVISAGGGGGEEDEFVDNDMPQFTQPIHMVEKRLW